MYSVYLITNLKNNKKYVGITSRSVKERYREHINRAVVEKRNNLLYKAIRKYGEDAFTVETLETNIPQNLGEEKERYYIEKYNTYYLNRNGYNMTIGGNGTIGYEFTDVDKEKISNAGKGRVFSPERNEKIRQAMLGRELSSEWREKISKARTGKYIGKENPFFGRHHSEETKHKARVTRNTRLVRAIDKETNEEILFDGISDAAKYVISIGRSCAKVNTVAGAIDKCCNKSYDRRSSYGFVWEFVERCND